MPSIGPSDYRRTPQLNRWAGSTGELGLGQADAAMFAQTLAGQAKHQGIELFPGESDLRFEGVPQRMSRGAVATASINCSNRLTANRNCVCSRSLS